MYLFLQATSTPLVTAGFWSTENEEPLVQEPIQKKPRDVPVEYGVDVSFPMHHAQVSTNYMWLEHNLHPDTSTTPKQYDGMVQQPLGNRQDFYKEYLEGCMKANGQRGSRCKSNEMDRVSMSLRQPQSMQVSFVAVHNCHGPLINHVFLTEAFGGFST